MQRRDRNGLWLALFAVLAAGWVAKQELVALARPPQASPSLAKPGATSGVVPDEGLRLTISPGVVPSHRQLRSALQQRLGRERRTDRDPLPAWLVGWLEPEGEAGEVALNRDANLDAAGTLFDPRHLQALQDIIDLNGLTEDSSPFDYDDGDGVFEPWELGFQVWQGSRLVALALGPDPFWSFEYAVEMLPPAIADLESLRYLDLHGNRLRELPPELGVLGELRELRAHRNRIPELLDAVGDLYQLRVLVLTGNPIAKLPDSLGYLERLERLHADDTRLQELPAGVGAIESLRVLGVARSGVERDGDAEAGGTGLSDLPQERQMPPHLQTLYLTGNRLGCDEAGPRVGSSVPQVFGLSAQRCFP